MQDAERVADGRRAVLVRAMPDAGLGDSGNHFSPHAYAPHGLVRGSVAHHLHEEWRFGKDLATAAGLRLLPNGLDGCIASGRPWSVPDVISSAVRRKLRWRQARSSQALVRRNSWRHHGGTPAFAPVLVSDARAAVAAAEAPAMTALPPPAGHTPPKQPPRLRKLEGGRREGCWRGSDRNRTWRSHGACMAV